MTYYDPAKHVFKYSSSQQNDWTCHICYTKSAHMLRFVLIGMTLHSISIHICKYGKWNAVSCNVINIALQIWEMECSVMPINTMRSICALFVNEGVSKQFQCISIDHNRIANGLNNAHHAPGVLSYSSCFSCFVSHFLGGLAARFT